MGLFLGSLICSIDPYVCFCADTMCCFDYCTLIVLSEVWEQFPVLLILTRSCVLEVSNSFLSSGSTVEMCAVSTGYLNFIPCPSPIPHSKGSSPPTFFPRCFQHSTFTVHLLLLQVCDLSMSCFPAMLCDP